MGEKSENLFDSLRLTTEQKKKYDQVVKKFTDNGSQLCSMKLEEFAEEYGFRLTTSSPYFAQANGAAEAAVKIAKKVLSSNKPDLALLNYRSTPHYATNVPPAVALMGRNLNTKIPILPHLLLPQQPDDKAIRSADHNAKMKYKQHYDRRHGVRSLPPLKTGDKVLVRKEGKWKKSGVILNGDVKNRTYVLNSNGRVQRRNRNHLQKIFDHIPIPEQGGNLHGEQEDNLPAPQVQISPRMTRSRTGVEIRKPLRYRDEI